MYANLKRLLWRFIQHFSNFQLTKMNGKTNHLKYFEKKIRKYNIFGSNKKHYGEQYLYNGD